MSRLLAAAMLVCPGCAEASSATPLAQQLIARLEQAKGGETITLKAGDYGHFTLPAKRFSPAVVLDARQARFTSVMVSDASGVTFLGGTIQGGGPGKTVGLVIRESTDVRVEGFRITAVYRGIILDRSQRVALVNNMLTGLNSDGINIALSHHVLVERNRCQDFRPTPAIFDEAGKRVKDGDHPDCIQAWSRPAVAPVSDIQVIGNDIDGNMQGIFFGNHVRNGIDDGGFDRIVVKNNRVRVGQPNGIRLMGARDSLVTDNQVSTIPGSTYPGGKKLVVAMLNISGERNLACGNEVEAMRAAKAAKPGKFPQVEPCSTHR